jgi:hypothetical protein
VSERPPSDTPDDRQEGLDQDTPYGAIAVTLFLAATILVFWFGMFTLNLMRS